MLRNQRLLIAEAMFAVARYQVEEVSFHPYTSKYDYWLEGKARLSESELRGLQAFNDPTRPIAPAVTPRRRPATACRRCSPITSTRRSVRRAMPRSPAIAIPTISISASAARSAPTFPSRRNTAACS
ncbi:hypothetical protein ACQ5SK_08780 [Bradyrhizobium japonicum]